MRILTILIIALLSTNAIAQKKIKWMTMNEAIEAQKEEPKKIFVDAYTAWCGWCKKMDKDTFAKADVAQYINDNFYPVKFDAEGNSTVDYKGQSFTNVNYKASRKNSRNSQHDFARLMQVRGYPAIVFIDAVDGFQAFSGYKKPRQLEVVLRMMKTDAYKELTTQEKYNEYVTDFEYTFSK